MTTLQEILTLLILTKFIFESMVSFLNLKKVHQQKVSVPNCVEGYMDLPLWQKCTNYTIAKTNYGRIENLISTIFSLFLLFFLLPFLYSKWEVWGSFGVWSSSIYTASFLILIQQFSLPLDWYRQFKLEQRFGFNKQTIKLWISDKMKELVLGVVLIGIVLVLLHFLYGKLSLLTSEYWWVLAFVALFLFQLFLMVLWPRLILPLFNKLTPLEDQELVAKLQKLSQKTGFQTKEILVIDGSKRSTHSNAFFTGFGKFRKIVLFDTLLKQLSYDEITSVVAHEIGHYKMGHIPKRLAISFFMGLLYFWFIDWLLNSAWFTSELNLPKVFAGELSPVLVFMIMFGGSITFWSSPISNFFSHKHEYEADLFAVSSTGSADGLLSALKKLSSENLSYPLPHRLVSVFYQSHPSLPQRDMNLNR